MRAVKSSGAVVLGEDLIDVKAMGVVDGCAVKQEA